MDGKQPPNRQQQQGFVEDPVVMEIRRREAEKFNRRLRKQMEEKLTTDQDGVDYAVRVARIQCHICGRDRWNDGTKCVACHVYPKAVGSSSDDSDSSEGL